MITFQGCLVKGIIKKFITFQFIIHLIKVSILLVLSVTMIDTFTRIVIC